MDGYAKLTLDGKEYGIKFGYLSFKLITQDRNRSMMFDEDGNPNDMGVTKIIYAGYQNNCVNKNTEAMPFDEFSRLFDKTVVEDGGVEKVTEIIQLWTESADVKELVEKNQEKKNLNPEPDLTLTNSNQSVLENSELVLPNSTE